jgi:hypothetical protein
MDRLVVAEDRKLVEGQLAVAVLQVVIVVAHFKVDWVALASMAVGRITQVVVVVVVATLVVAVVVAEMIMALELVWDLVAVADHHLLTLAM